MIIQNQLVFSKSWFYCIKQLGAHKKLLSQVHKRKSRKKFFPHFCCCFLFLLKSWNDWPTVTQNLGPERKLSKTDCASTPLMKITITAKIRWTFNARMPHQNAQNDTFSEKIRWIVIRKWTEFMKIGMIFHLQSRMAKLQKGILQSWQTTKLVFIWLKMIHLHTGHCIVAIISY